MGRKYNRILSAILQEPVSGNIHWREVESLLHHLGATIEHPAGAKVRVTLNNIEGVLHYPHHSGVCGKHELRYLRDYLVSAGVSLSS